MHSLTQPILAPQPLLAAAAAIVTASKLSLGDDHHETVAIVAQVFGKLDANEVDGLAIQDWSREGAARIVHAALECAVSDEATSSPNAPATLSVPVSDTTPDLTVTPMMEVVTVIREIMLPIAEHMVAQEAEMAGIYVRLARLEASTAQMASI